MITACKFEGKGLNLALVNYKDLDPGSLRQQWGPVFGSFSFRT